MTGPDVLRRLRGFGEPIPVIVITSALVLEIRTRELEGGATRMPLGKAGVDSVLLDHRQTALGRDVRLLRGVGR